MTKYLIWIFFPALTGSAHAQQVPKDSTGKAVSGTVQRGTPKNLKLVTVSAGAFEASDKAKGASLTPMDAVTVAGSNGDLTQSLRSLPGVQQIGETEGLFVRGGTSDETKQFIDGTLFKYPNYPSVPGIPQGARINPFLFKGILFSSGGYSALYGQAMSSALILESVDLPEKSSASFYLFPANQGAGLQHLGKDNRSSFGLGLNYSNQTLYNALVPHVPDYFQGPSYLEGNANYRIKTGRSGMFKVYAVWNKSAVGMYNQDVDSAALRSGYLVKGGNIYTNMSYRTALGNDWKMEAGLAYSNNKDKRIISLVDAAEKPATLPEVPLTLKNNASDIRSDFAQARVVLTRFLAGGQAVRFGAEHFYTKDAGVYRDSALAQTDQLSAVFAESDIYLTSSLAAKVGLRLEHTSLPAQWSLAPRASLAWRLSDESQLNFAYGLFYQEPQNEFLYRNRDLSLSRAAHYVVNYTRRAHNRFFRVEAYYKQYQDLVRLLPPDARSVSTGNGYAKGVELFYRDKKTFKNLDYWITYTYLDTKRDYLNYPMALRPPFAAPHTMTIAVKKFFPDLSTGVNVSYALAAGRPYYNIRYSDGWQLADQGTTKPYSIVNLHISHLMTLFPRWKHKDFSGFAVGVNNVLGTKQVFGYNYSYDGQHKMAVSLPANRTFFVGFFMSLGIDRTDDFLNNNL
ncbi:TonB-dependent receptor plug domain-containing protein [Chitinophaga oryzae]|uniref:TonB-dependent receptor plug domain-containing protein n=1 Tax=Chitinophaga oryzae TaxID=2725414 RepID=A0ABX6LNR1_9BACT|nr:TonB-dependent receptor plug domain-containing protein [Chitinophaga oryzae]QJB41683.1 TonB-dependent receptor plug domain-containing protein [Chitinophaga oryzae]